MNKDQKRVLKRYPMAKLTILEDGSYAVEAEDQLLAEEYLLPPAEDPETAWKYAALSCKTTQNFNRTHPDRLDLSNFETKLNRIQKRKRHATKN